MFYHNTFEIYKFDVDMFKRCPYCSLPEDWVQFDKEQAIKKAEENASQAEKYMKKAGDLAKEVEENSKKMAELLKKIQEGNKQSEEFTRKAIEQMRKPKES